MGTHESMKLCVSASAQAQLITLKRDPSESQAPPPLSEGDVPSWYRLWEK